MTEEKKMPEFVVRAGGVKATVWKNVNKDKQEYFSIGIAKNYKEGEEWKTTNNYNVSDLHKLRVVVTELLSKLVLSKDEPKETK